MQYVTLTSTLDLSATSAKIIAKLYSHDALLARNHKPIAAQTIQALATTCNSCPDVICSNPVCGQPGHTNDKCFRPGGGMASQYPDWWKKKGKPTNPSLQPSVNIAIVPQSSSVTHSGDHSGEFYAFMTKIQGQEEGNLQRTTYADSAASKHCSTDSADFIMYEPYKGNGKTATKGGEFAILGTGKVVKRAIYDGHIVQLSFKNAYHCPDLSHNLISIGHLDRAGCFSVFSAGGVTFLNPSGSPFLYGKSVGTMYEVEVFPPTGRINAKPLTAPPSGMVMAPEARDTVVAFATHLLDKQTDADTWHRRLGHPSYDMVERMYRRGIVEGLTITNLARQPGLCEDCIMGKQSQCPFDGNIHPASEVLKHIHIDLWGPSHVASIGGKQYMMEAVNAYEGHTEGYFLTDKEAGTTLTALEQYVALAECQMGRKVKHLQVNGGPEFCNKLWEDWCGGRGILLELNTAYSSETNGIVEHSHCTVIEHTCTLMVKNSFPPSMWCELAATVLYLKDFIPTAQHPDTTLYESWHQVKPNISHLHPIGCTAYAKIPVKRGRSKLDARSIKGVLIGYFGRDAYQIFDPETQKIFHSCDVIFEEGLGHKTLPLPIESVDDLGHVLPVTNTGTPLDTAEPNAQTTPDAPVITEPVLHHSACTAKPSTAIINSMASERAIEVARTIGKDWATDSIAPTTVHYVSLGDSTARLEGGDGTITVSLTSLPEPTNHWLPDSYTEAMTRPDLWQDPIDKELAVMHECGVWDVVDPPPDVCLVKMCWTFANKYDRDGALTSQKARLVAKGFTQIPGVDFYESYASVVWYESL